MRLLISLKPFDHRRQECVGIYGPFDPELNLSIRKLKGVKWSQTHKVWYLPMGNDSLAQIKERLQPLGKLDVTLLKKYLHQKREIMQTLPKGGNSISASPPIKTKINTHKAETGLSADNLNALKAFTQHLQLKGYSASTFRTYRSEFLQFLKVLKTTSAECLTPTHVKRYMVYAIEKERLKENTAHSRLNALKFYYEQVLRREKFFLEIPRQKKPLLLPRFFNQDEIAYIINETTNIKHKAMLMLAYSSGLRVSEVVAIKTSNIDSQRMSILIEDAKGKKDRMVNLSPVLLVMLREYWKKYKPAKSGYLFAGQNEKEPYSTRSLQLVLAAAKKKAGILKPGSIHALRHSFATHLLDKGTDVTMIMKLLGHNDIRTTLRYLHVTNRDVLQVISPLDDLKLKI